MVVRRTEGVSTVLRVYVLVMLVAAAIAVVELVVGLPSVLGDDHAFYTLKARIITPIGDHNELAGWLLVALVFAAGVQPTRLPVLLLLALGLGTTLSRGALVAGLIAVVVGWFLGLDRAMLRRLLAGLVLAGALVLSAVALLDTTVPTDGPTSSAAARIDLWGVALDDIRDEPVLGVGLGSFEDTAADVAGPHHHAHNGTLHALAELGLVAGLAAAIRLPLATWLLLRQPTTQGAQVAGLGGLALLAHDQVEALALRPVSEILVACLLASAVRQGTSPATEWR
jgi:O-antigen ligase